MGNTFRPHIPWLFNGIKVTSAKEIYNVASSHFPSLASFIETNKYKVFDLYGFIYKLSLIDLNTNKDYYYIGKKNVFQIKTLNLRVNKLPRPGHIRFKKRVIKHKRVDVEEVKVETNWLVYNSSSQLVSQYEIVRKEIIDISFSKMYLTYLETKYLFQNNVLEDDTYLNENILGKFYKGKLHSNEACVEYEQTYRSEL